MNINDAKKGLFNIQVDVTKSFPNAQDKLVITFREFDVSELDEIRKIFRIKDAEKKDDEQFNFFKKKLPDLIVDHPFGNENGEKASNAEVADLIMKSYSLYAYVSEACNNGNPYRKESGEKLQKSPPDTLRESDTPLN